MPRFAANLGYLFTERPLLERIDVAAAAGFKAIELQFPYDVPADAVRAAIERNRLTILGLNTSSGREGEFGLAAVPGRQKEWQTLFARARLCKRNRRERHSLSGRQSCTRATTIRGPCLSRQSDSSGRPRLRQEDQTADR